MRKRYIAAGDREQREPQRLRCDGWWTFQREAVQREPLRVLNTDEEARIGLKGYALRLHISCVDRHENEYRFEVDISEQEMNSRDVYGEVRRWLDAHREPPRAQRWSREYDGEWPDAFTGRSAGQVRPEQVSARPLSSAAQVMKRDELLRALGNRLYPDSDRVLAAQAARASAGEQQRQREREAAQQTRDMVRALSDVPPLVVDLGTVRPETLSPPVRPPPPPALDIERYLVPRPPPPPPAPVNEAAARIAGLDLDFDEPGEKKP